MDLNSHADSPCLGSNAIVIYETLCTVNVSAFINSVGRKLKVPIVHGALAYDCPYTGKVMFSWYIMHFTFLRWNIT
jgi:hypothetical protein